MTLYRPGDGGLDWLEASDDARALYAVEVRAAAAARTAAAAPADDTAAT